LRPSASSARRIGHADEEALKGEAKKSGGLLRQRPEQFRLAGSGPGEAKAIEPIFAFFHALLDETERFRGTLAEIGP
jgi:hypothetical protein